MEKATLLFEFEKDTKNFVRYSLKPGQTPVVTLIYVAKFATGETPPKEIKVTVEEVAVSVQPPEQGDVLA